MDAQICGVLWLLELTTSAHKCGEKQCFTNKTDQENPNEL